MNEHGGLPVWYAPATSYTKNKTVAMSGLQCENPAQWPNSCFLVGRLDLAPPVRIWAGSLLILESLEGSLV